jgi:starch synthase
LRVLSVASEVFPLVKTGGLADVVGALPGALKPLGVSVRTLVPGYPGVMEKIERPKAVARIEKLFGGSARLLAAKAHGLDLFVLDAPHLFGRPGNPYVDQHGRDWPDNAYRFAALSQLGAMIGTGLVPGYQPHVVHAHDWQAGLAPAYLHYRGGDRPGTVMTVHNLAFQGRFPAELLQPLGLPPASLSMVDGVEYFGGIGFLKAGLRLADRITTVSPTYAAEISTPEGGMGLGGLIRGRADLLSGILNGIDTTVWNPAADPHLKAMRKGESLAWRRQNKQALKARFGLSPRAESMLFGVISRLTEQKGVDLLFAALPRLLALGADLVVLGAGDAALEQAFRAAALASPERVGVFIGYDEPLAHLIQGGSDALLVPSRFEPCGLTQLCAMRYGSAPVVARVGGLADTVIDANEMALAAGVATGFQFYPVAREPLERAIARAVSLWREPKTWRRLQENGMTTDVGWRRPAEKYAAIYREVAAARQAAA